MYLFIDCHLLLESRLDFFLIKWKDLHQQEILRIHQDLSNLHLVVNAHIAVNQLKLLLAYSGHLSSLPEFDGPLLTEERVPP